MKNVLLMGISGRIGKNLYKELKSEYNLFAFSIPNQKEDVPGITLLKKDLFILPEVEEALKGIDIVIFFEDPIMRLNRLTQGKFYDIYSLIADNIARASKLNGVEQVIYVADEISSGETMKILGAYGTPVEVTETPVKRYGKNLSYKASDYNNVRSIQKAPLPEGWPVKRVAEYYFEWLNEILYNVMNVVAENGEYKIYLSHVEHPILVVTYDREESVDDIELYQITGGILSKRQPNKIARLEFRRLGNQEEFIMALHDFEPNLPWGIYIFTQAPLNALVNRIYQVEMIISRHESRE
ncbi:Rossmann-fold NAD(P)-binding domain-containing protein [Salinicoccus sp. Marseille-QA3877]